MLAGLRVLELSGCETMLAGSILADLGAEVIVVEPPGGAEGRRLEPFLDDIPGLERGLTWQALNRNKRGLTLDLASSDGLELLEMLISKSDVLIERTETGNDRSIGEGVKMPPEVIHCVIRPFHPGGPKGDYQKSDLVLMAASGSLGMMGDADRPPTPMAVPQAMMEIGAEAAIAVLGALNARDRDGLGQLVTVTGRFAAMASAFSTPVTIGSGNPEAPRSSGGAIAGVKVPSIFGCRDGFSVGVIAFGSAWGPMTNRLAEWAGEEGTLVPELAERDWSGFPAEVQSGKAAPAELEALVAGISELFASKTKDAIWQEALRRALLVAPVMDMADIAASPQFEERGVWNQFGFEGRSIRIPARFAQFSDYSIDTHSTAPLLSQDTVTVLRDELGLSSLEVQALFVGGVI